VQVGIFRPVNRSNYFTITQPGCSSGYAIRPTTAVAGINSGLLTFHLNKTASETKPIRAVSQSPMAMQPSRMQAPRIVPIAAARFAGRRTAIAAARSRSLSVDLGQDQLEIAKIDIKSTQSGSESN